MSEPGLLVVVKGAGDLATGVALAFHAAGFGVIMTELPQPTAIRRTVSFAEAVYAGGQAVEGVRAKLSVVESWATVLQQGQVAVLVDPQGAVLGAARPSVVVDAIMAKANTGTARMDGAVVIALGPGFSAGMDVDAVIETMRGHELGRVIRDGSARPNTGTPGDIGGKTSDRVLNAPCDGGVVHCTRIGDMVKKGDAVMRVEGQPVIAPFDGCVRGLISDTVRVRKGMKIGDVDPRGEARFVNAVSDKARAVGRAALEAALAIGRERGLLKLVR
jgi:xanthine dehydrogenase accessory factor